MFNQRWNNVDRQRSSTFFQHWYLVENESWNNPFLYTQREVTRYYVLLDRLRYLVKRQQFTKMIWVSLFSFSLHGSKIKSENNVSWKRCLWFCLAFVKVHLNKVKIRKVVLQISTKNLLTLFISLTIEIIRHRN